MCFSCPPAGPGLDGEAAAKDKTEGAGTPYISVQPFPALLDLPCGADAVAASCGSRHTAVVTREWVTGVGGGSYVLTGIGRFKGTHLNQGGGRRDSGWPALPPHHTLCLQEPGSCFPGAGVSVSVLVCPGVD